MSINNNNNDNNVTYFESCGVPKEINYFIGNEDIITNIFSIQTYDSIMCGYFFIRFRFIFLRKGIGLLDYTNLFSSNDYEKNDKIILKYFQ